MAADNLKYKSPLHETVCTTATDLWNDSCAVEELTYSMDHGAVGATTNPTIVCGVLKQEMHLWKDRIAEMIRDRPTASEVDVAWRLIEEAAVKGAELLAPVFEREKGSKGRLSIQTNPQNYRNAEALADQAEHFAKLAPNMQVKIPVTSAGISAIEEATYRGVNVNATVCFTVPQTLAVADAVERGLQRRAAEGLEVDSMTPVCTLMVGRIDDWLKVAAKKEGRVVTPGVLDWAGVACIKEAYRIYRERGYRARLLAAAYRNHLQWSELIGGDIILTIPCPWQKLFNDSDIEVKPRFDNPVPAEVLAELNELEQFRKAYRADGLTREEFDTFGATVRTLRGFIASYQELLALVRDFMLPNPD